MLALARALVPKPKLLMLDEPSLGLAPNLLDDVFEKIGRINRETGVAILIVEQKVREILKVCGRVYSLKLGKVSFSGLPDELQQDKEALKRVFLWALLCYPGRAGATQSESAVGHIRTAYPVESPFLSVQLRTNAAKRFKKVENATAIPWKVLMVAEERFKCSRAPELVKRVIEGVIYADGRQQDVEQRTKAV
ncbi:MAG: hypothetical protein JW759_03710 [Candidatus Coatesbacteria bacterium]|nr:hypothetical protein [Candidatus Coatesbacteria bacterium]